MLSQQTLRKSTGVLVPRHILLLQAGKIGTYNNARNGRSFSKFISWNMENKLRIITN